MALRSLTKHLKVPRPHLAATLSTDKLEVDIQIQCGQGYEIRGMGFLLWGKNLRFFFQPLCGHAKLVNWDLWRGDLGGGTWGFATKTQRGALRIGYLNPQGKVSVLLTRCKQLGRKKEGSEHARSIGDLHLGLGRADANPSNTNQS